MRLLELAATITLSGGFAMAGPVPADDGLTTGNLSRWVELPSHEWLAVVRGSPDVELAPFTTDGCSGGMSSLWTFTAERYPAFARAHDGVPPWEPCCVTHDRAYHRGGEDPDPESSYAARVAADEALRQCVIDTADARNVVLQQTYGLSEPDVDRVYEAIAAAMFHAVRLGGQPCTGLPWRWGYGYPHCWETLP